jgi:hypothetical protein
LLRDLSVEFHDQDHEAANLSQALHLMKQANLRPQAFLHILYTARSITKQQGHIEKEANEGHGFRNKMPYFFAVLRDELGISHEA